MKKASIGIAAVLAAATWFGVKTGALPKLGEARAEGPPLACICPPGDLLCSMRCSHRGIPVTIATEARPPKQVKPAKTEAPRAAAPPATPPEQPPAALDASIVRSGSEPARVVVNRPGHVVALSHGMKRTVGSASAGVALSELVPQGRAPAESPVEITWETTRFGTFAMQRGTLRLVDEGGGVGVKLSESGWPTPVRIEKGTLHTCASYRDTQSGFTVVCQLDKAAWRVGVANLTGANPLQDVLSTPGEAPTVRLDLPLVQGGAEARLLGYISGVKGIALRAEASWVEGEDGPSITIGVVERADSSFRFLFADPLFWKRRPHRHPHPDLDLFL